MILVKTFFYFFYFCLFYFYFYAVLNVNATVIAAVNIFLSFDIFFVDCHPQPQVDNDVCMYCIYLLYHF